MMYLGTTGIVPSAEAKFSRGEETGVHAQQLPFSSPPGTFSPAASAALSARTASPIATIYRR
ncbi:hypothetical protein FB466_0930 [Klugiella xanthotipulae]|uniref:Uncharacterized protein n=1 Tax=Klugiella xanthotipulae TaxID=244735 RepID=A0A543I6B4_9MICO|nr:hypothetical protein FB466_0930 [Klugiella xanthotipulae]